MCGIAGILGKVDPGLVGRMCDRIAHRGPDGHGTWSDDGVTLGHRRLAIIDIESGAQPMESHDGRYCVIYNGEIYNHVALRRRLKAAGCTFRTDHCDTEVLLEGYRHWGADVVSRLEGMFAFALWDTQEKLLLLARDPWGVKPLFYACHGDELLFASEQKALFAHPDLHAAPDLDHIKERAALEFLVGQHTLFAGIHQLPPGTFVELRGADELRAPLPWQPYYHIPAEEFSSIEDAARTIKDRFVASVEEQLMSDVPLGVILSGGFDSAAVATAHQRFLADTPIHTFTVAESEEVEDYRMAKRLAEELGTDHHESFFSLENVMRDMPRYAWHNENINYTEFFFMPLFDAMSRHVKVGLCGQGSDELWGGYNRYNDPLPLARERLRRIRAAAPSHAEELATTVTMTHVAGSALSEWDQQGQLNNFQLRLVDRNSMAASLEVRVPFLSRPLHQASRAVPWGWKLRGGVEKWILRKALSDLGMPDDLTWRPKVPAGRATSPRVMQEFEAEAARLARPADEHPLGGAMATPAERLVYDLWHEVFVERDGKIGDLTLEALA